MPNKPVKVGILVYQASARLTQTHKAIVFAFLVRLGGRNALSPQLSMLCLVDMVGKPIHVFADSAFLAKATMQMIPPSKATFSISVGESNQSGLLPVVKYLNDGLPAGGSCTAVLNGCIIQAKIKKSNPQHTTVVATNA
jgi:hypothetical protein